MSKILKKNTAILQVPEKVINDKNKLINSTTNKGDLKKGTIKIETGKNLKIVSKGTLINQGKEVKPKPTKEVKPKPTKETKPKPTKETKPKPTKEPEIYKDYFITFPIIIKPLTEKELKKNFNREIYGYVDSIEKFNKLKFKDKFNVEINVEKNGDILNDAFTSFLENNSNNLDTQYKLDRAYDKYSKIFYKEVDKLRKESKLSFLNFINSLNNDVENYRFIF